MRIPRDVSLASYIRQLIKADKIVVFYKSEDWMELKDNVLEFYHYECQSCLKNGVYTRADCVHHVNEVRQRPDLALSMYFKDNNGKEQPNLLPLCNACHNIVHDKLGQWQRKDKFFNEERW